MKTIAILIFVFITLNCRAQSDTNVFQPVEHKLFYKDRCFNFLRELTKLNKDSFNQYSKVLLRVGETFIDTIPLNNLRKETTNALKFNSSVCDTLFKGENKDCHTNLAYIRSILKDRGFRYPDNAIIKVENGLIKVLVYYKSTNYWSGYYYKFDENGLLIFSKDFYKKPSDTNFIPTGYVSHYYYYNNKLLERVDSAFDNNLSNMHGDYIHFIDRFSYKLNGDLEKKTTKFLFEGGTVISENYTDYIYNESNKLSKEVYYKTVKGKYSFFNETNYEYDEANRLIRISINGEGSPNITWVEYNNNVIKKYIMKQHTHGRQLEYQYELLK